MHHSDTSLDKRKEANVFFWLIIAFSFVIRGLWLFFFSEEYWGDAYHNLWMVNEFEELGRYVDYKDRHVVWLPLFRLLLIAVNGVADPRVLTLLLHGAYLLVVAWWCRKTGLADSFYPMLILAFWPLALTFSGFSMPENLSLLTVTIVLVLLLNGGSSLKMYIWVAIFSAMSALTRHEATAFLGILSLILFLFGRKKNAFAITAGIFAGLMIFSSWCFVETGDPFFWLSSKFSASSAGASAFIDTHGFGNRLLESLLSLVMIMPAFPLLFSARRTIITWRRLQQEEWIVVVTTVLFLAVFFVASLFFFHGADPKYLLVASFPCSVFTIRVLRYYSETIVKVASIGLLILGVVFMHIFYFRSFNLELERELGRMILNDDSIQKGGRMWSDFPTVLYYADWDPAQVVSSELVVEKMKSSNQDFPIFLKQTGIDYLVVADADRTLLLNFLPELQSAQGIDTINVHAMKFVRLKSLNPVQTGNEIGSGGFYGPIKSYVISQNRPISLWKLDITDD